MGAHSNFMNIIAALDRGGGFSAALPGYIDGRALAAASRSRKISTAFRNLSTAQQKVLFYYSKGHSIDPLIGIIIHSKHAEQEWKESKSKRTFEDWIIGLIQSDPKKSTVKARKWMQLKADARRKLDEAVEELSKWY